MSFGYSVLGFGAFPSRGSIPTGMHIQDATGADDRITVTVGGSATHGVNPLAPMALLQDSTTFVLGLYGDTTGGDAVTTWTWTITGITDLHSLIASSSNVSGSASQNYTNLTFTTNASLPTGRTLTIAGKLECSNSIGDGQTSGGDTEVAFNFDFMKL